MAVAKENDLVSSICIVKILNQEFLRYAFFCKMYFVFGSAKKKKKKKKKELYFFVSFHTNSAIT